MAIVDLLLQWLFYEVTLTNTHRLWEPYRDHRADSTLVGTLVGE